ncbi:MAG: T9SS type A sorting domain-containing protein [Saprospiraceae bacterium]
MKHIAIFLSCVFFLLSGSALAQKWEQYTNSDYFTLRTYKFGVAKGTPFVVLYDGLYRGSAGGTKWEKIRDFDVFGTSYYFFEVNHTNGYIYFNSSVDSSGGYPIYESPDLGKTWTKLNLFPTLYNGCYDLAFIGDTLYTIQPFEVYKKFGPGQPEIMPSWPSDTAGQVFDITAQGNDLWVVTKKGLYHSPDAGYTWQHALKRNVAFGHPFPPYVFPLKDEVFFQDKNTNLVLYSADKGASWTEIPWATKYRIFYSGEHLYTSNAVQIGYVLRIDGDPFAGDTIWVDANYSLDLAGVGEFDGKLWLGSGRYGMLSKEAGEEAWQINIDGFGPYMQALAYYDGYLFSKSTIASVSVDDGDTWNQTFNRPWAQTPRRIGNTYFGVLPRALVSCPANGRFEWDTVYTFPANQFSFTQLGTGDTAVVVCNSAADKVYRTVDRGQSWEDISANMKGVMRFWKGKLYGFNAQDSTCVVSEDLGDTWTALHKFSVSLHPSKFKFNFLGDTFLVAYTHPQIVYYSVDGGQHFDAFTIPTFPNNLLALWVFENRLCIVVNDNDVYTSTDAGKTWSTLPYLNQGPPFSQYLATNGNGLLAGGNDILFYYGYRLRLDQFRQISGTVFLDLNSNGQWDGTETGQDGRLVQSAKTGTMGATYNNGHFSMLLSKATADTIRITNVPKYYSASPAFKLVPAGQTAQPVQFALRPQGQINDAAVSVVPTSGFRAGYTNSLQVQVENLGTIPLSGQLKLVLDPQLEQLSFDPMADAQIGDTLVWEYSNLKPLQTRNFRADVRTAVVPPGTPVQVFAQTQNGPDVDESNNTFLVDAKVQSSYDPNDKAVSHETLPVAQLSESELLYTIRFQNLGNIATDFITIRDTLSAAIDPSSIRVLRSSHKYSWSMEDGHILVFSFNPIALAPAGVDSLRSQGFVQFAARLHDDLQAGADIANTAHIYFDFNPAVVTNTVHTVIQTVATLEPAKEALRLEVFPNPAREQVTLRLPEGFGKVAGRIEIFDTNGKLLLFRQTQSDMEAINAGDLSAGSYWCRWQQGPRSFWGKLIVVR